MANAAITVDLNARIAQFETELKRASGSLDAFGKKGSTALASLKSFGAGLAGALSVGAVVNFAKAGIDAADSLNDMSIRLGVSVKDLASFKLAAEQSGSSLEGIGGALAELNKSIGLAEGGNKKIAAALRELGVSAKDPKEAFYQLADGIERIEDPQKRAALLSKVLKGSFNEMLPVLAQGSDDLRRSAEASEDFADAMARLAPNADKFNDEMARMQQEAAGAAGALLQRMVPGLADTAARVRELLDDDKGIQALVRAIAGIGKLPFDAIFGDIKVAATASDRIKELRGELGGLESDLKKALPGGSRSSKALRALFGTPEDINQQITVIKNQIVALEKFGEKIYKPKPAPAAKAPGVVDLSAATKTTKTTKAFDVEAMRIADIEAAWKGAGDELQRYADDRAFVLEGDLERDNAINGIAQEWVEAGRALTEEFQSPLEKAAIELERIQFLLSKNLISPEVAVLARESIEIGLMEPMKETKTLAEEIGLSFTSAFEDAIASGEDFGNVLKSLEQDIAKLLVRKTVTEPLMGALNGLDFGAILGGLIPSANGNVFSNLPGLSAYSGSIVSRPTIVPFASGGALFGEAGPEAILPLKRGANGKLGVEGGGSSVQVNVINNADGTRATASERNDGGVRTIDVIVEQVEGKMSRRLSRGEGLAPAMERRYGLNPAPGGYR